MHNERKGSSPSKNYIYFIVLSLYIGMNTLPYINLNASGKVPLQALGHLDDGSSEAIFVNGAKFPFGDTYHSVIYVSQAS